MKKPHLSAVSFVLTLLATPSFALAAAPAITTAPVGGLRDAGVSSSLTVVASSSPSPTYQWYRGTATSPTTAISGATGATYTLASPATTDTSYYSVRVSNALGSITTEPVLVTYQTTAGGIAAGAFPTFLGSSGQFTTNNGNVNAILPLPDGSYVVGGAFKRVATPGVPLTLATPCPNLAHILANGTLDPNTTFPFVSTGMVTALHRDSSGRIIVATTGDFAYRNSVSFNRTGIFRILSDGSVDPTFLSPFTSNAIIVYAIATDTNGNVYVGGQLPGAINGNASNQYLKRLDGVTGAIDPAFVPEPPAPPAQVLNLVRALHLRADGKLLVGHNGGTMLLNSTGARDMTFPGRVENSLAFLPQTNGDVIVSSINAPYLFKLDSAGSSVAGFPAATLASLGTPDHLLALPNGDFLASGTIAPIGFQYGNLKFFNADGTVDPGYSIGTACSAPVYTTALDLQGRIMVGGTFDSYNGTTVNRITRLETSGTTPSDPGAPVPDAYTQSLIDAGIPANQRGTADDPDGDGISNLLEYALGLSPGVSSAAGLPAITKDANTISLTYHRTRIDVTYMVEMTTDLANPGSWTSSGIDQGTPGPGGATTASAPASAATQFMRLRVTQIN